MLEAMALYTPPALGPLSKRGVCDCLRTPCSWHRLLSNAPQDLMQQACPECVQTILLKQYLWNELQKTNLTSRMPANSDMLLNSAAKVFFKNEECQS